MTSPTPPTQYRVWHIPQIPGKPFYVEIESLDNARLIVGVLADYDLFQYEPSTLLLKN